MKVNKCNPRAGAPKEKHDFANENVNTSSQHPSAPGERQNYKLNSVRPGSRLYRTVDSDVGRISACMGRTSIQHNKVVSTFKSWHKRIETVLRLHGTPSSGKYCGYGELRAIHQTGYGSRGTVIATPYLVPWAVPYMNILVHKRRVNYGIDLRTGHHDKTKCKITAYEVERHKFYVERELYTKTEHSATIKRRDPSLVSTCENQEGHRFGLENKIIENDFVVGRLHARFHRSLGIRKYL
ncbi:hypothetical protein CLF_107262 [Clonorchis sinensis]|uniref:Uncharacterized protein n=1 Tax=Clonorchis sinensis TaxID=79923 RepID=G7YGG2_CLOSI|nr:hypothetical protein CLF_107262 [Clonorchis sinensis]